MFFVMRTGPMATAKRPRDSEGWSGKPSAVPYIVGAVILGLFHAWSLGLSPTRLATSPAGTGILALSVVFNAVVVAASAIWVARDAHRHGDAWEYAFGVIIWWALVFPLYVTHRMGLRKGALVFVIALAYSAVSILAVRRLM